MTTPLEMTQPCCGLCLFTKWFLKAFFKWSPNSPTKAQVKLPFLSQEMPGWPRNCMCVVFHQTIGSVVFIGDFPNFHRPQLPSASH